MTTVHVVTLAPTLAVPAQFRSRGTVYSSHPLSSLTAHARGRALRRRCLATTVCAAHGPSRRTRGQRRTHVGVQTLAIPALMECGGEVEGAREGGAVDVWTLQVGRHTRAVEAQVYTLFCHRGVTFVVAGAALLLQTLQHGADAQPVVAAQRTTHRTSRLRDISTYIHAARSVITLVVVGGTRRRHGTVEGVRDAGRVAAHVRRGLGTVRRYTRIDRKGNCQRAHGTTRVDVPSGTRPVVAENGGGIRAHVLRVARVDFRCAVSVGTPNRRLSRAVERRTLPYCLPMKRPPHTCLHTCAIRTPKWGVFRAPVGVGTLALCRHALVVPAAHGLLYG